MIMQLYFVAYLVTFCILGTYGQYPLDPTSNQIDSIDQHTITDERSNTVKLVKPFKRRHHHGPAFSPNSHVVDISFQEQLQSVNDAKNNIMDNILKISVKKSNYRIADRVELDNHDQVVNEDSDEESEESEEKKQKEQEKEEKKQEKKKEREEKKKKKEQEKEEKKKEKEEKKRQKEEKKREQEKQKQDGQMTMNKEK
ncbi:hypothetical protein I4U23_015113 [Adineta vaga]|nr:hypothetical protein I4U23_015113 [Adineta vaga]